MKYLNYILVILVLSFSTQGCQKKEADVQPQGGFAVNVVAVKAQSKDLSRRISLVGTLEANESVDIMSEVEGKVETVNFEEGQIVKKGALLFQIDKNKLQASYGQAEANLKLAETTEKRYASLVQTKAVSQQEYEQTLATLEANKAAFSLSKERLNDATIKAPFDGIMGERLISQGQYINQGALLTYVFSPNPMKAEFRVPERYISEIQVGQQVSLSVAAYIDETFKGEVFFIAPQVNEQTRTVLMKARVDNADLKLKSGMFANLKLTVNQRAEAIVVPETALITKGDQVSIFVVKSDNTADLRIVETGQRLDGMVEILSGVNVDETVIIEGYQKIGPGSSVNPTIQNPTEKKVYEII